MKNKKMNIFVKHLLIAAGVLVVLVIAVLLALNSYTHHGEEEVVPNVKNMSIEKAANILKAKNLTYEVVDSIFNRDALPGNVVEQDPVEGVIVKKNRKIYLVLNSSSVQKMPLPEVKDISLRQAMSMLQAIEFKVANIEYKNSEYKDLVLGVKYNGRVVNLGDKIPVRSALTLVVGNGQTGALAKVPNLIGLPYAQALQTTEENAFYLNEGIFDKTPSNKNDEAKFVIYKQEPKPNSSLTTGEYIQVWLSKTPDLYPPQVPDSSSQGEKSMEETISF